jgi:hypothetical protein
VSRPSDAGLSASMGDHLARCRKKRGRQARFARRLENVSRRALRRKTASVGSDNRSLVA